MKSRIATLCAALFCISAISAQSVKKVKYASDDGTHKKTYFVLKEDDEIKHGEYEEIYKNVVITHGEYDMGERSGLWEFSSYDGSLKFSGSYTEGRKDGHWSYYRNDLLVSEKFVSDGRVDSLFSHYSKGKPALEQRMDSSGTGDTYAYYENGVIKEHSPLDDRVINGTVTMRFENGELFRRVEYRKGVPHEVLETYSKDGEPLDDGTLKDGSGTFLRYAFADEGKLSFPSEFITYSNGVRNGLYIKYFPGGRVAVQGDHTDGEKTGIWESVDSRGLIVTEHPNDDLFISDEGTTEGLQRTAGGGGSWEERIPEYPAGERGLMQFLASSIHYPTAAKRAGAQGTVYTSFTVDEDGFITHPEIAVSVHKSLDEECLRLMNMMPRWDPGFQNGIPVNVRYKLPIRFNMR